MSVSGDDWIQDAFQTEKCNKNNETRKSQSKLNTGSSINLINRD